MEEKKSAEPQAPTEGPPISEQEAEELDLFASSTTGELDESSLDLFLQKNDVQFVESLKTIGEDKELVAQEIVLSDLEQELADEINHWENSTGPRKILFKILPFIPRLSLYIKKLKFRFFNYLRGLWVRFKNFSYYLATDGRQKLIKSLLQVKTNIGGKVGAASSSFSNLPRLQKLGVFGVLGLIVVTGVFIYRAATVGVIHNSDGLFIPSLESVAEETYDYEPETEMEPFYENLRSTQNIFLLPKMVVNIKRGTQSGPNPMVAMEFFIEGMVPEVIVEMKDREAMFKDAIQRVIEDFSFDQLETPSGKIELRERIRKEINGLLTKGTVKKVMIKNVVLKP